MENNTNQILNIIKKSSENNTNLIEEVKKLKENNGTSLIQHQNIQNIHYLRVLTNYSMLNFQIISPVSFGSIVISF